MKRLLHVIMAANRAVKLPRPRREGPRPPLWGLLVGRLIIAAVGVGLIYLAITVTPFLVILFLPLIIVGGGLRLVARRFTRHR